MRSRMLPVVLVVLGLVVVAVIAGGSTTFPPLDPRSTQPDGTRAAVLLLEELGADVDLVRGPVPDDAATALVLIDRLNEDDTDAVLDWVDDGGVLVVHDLGSDLLEPLVDAPFGCPTAALAEVERLQLPGGRTVTGEEVCGGGFVASVDVGAGSIVEVAPASAFLVAGGDLGAEQDEVSPLSNALLDEADNAVLVASLLAPTGDERVAVLLGSVGGTGDEDLYDLLGPSWRQAVFQLLVVAVLLVLWRGRRLGRPVAEPQSVSIAGSELVAAVGRLLDARRRPDEAAAILRAEVRKALELRVGVAADGPVEAAAEAVAARTGLDPAEVADALEYALVTSDEQLVALAARLDVIRSSVLGAADPTHTPRSLASSTRTPPRLATTRRSQ